MKKNTVSEVAVKKLQGSISSKKSKVLKDVFYIKTTIYKLLWKYTWPVSCFKKEEKPEVCKQLIRRGVHKLVQEKRNSPC